MTKEKRAANREACIQAAVDDFYRTGGWTPERRARFAPIWAEVCRSNAERTAAGAAAHADADAASRNADSLPTARL